VSTDPPPAQFDAHAESYDADLDSGLALSGEDKSYYARGRIGWFKQRLAASGDLPAAPRVLDFGCGDGFAAPLLRGMLGASSVTGVDVSAGLLDIARQRYAGAGIGFELLDQGWARAGEFDLAYTNGVFHHIPPDQRAKAFEQVRSALKRGGVFAFWENNPWNPGTRLVMRRIEFDRTAITISPPEGRRLLRAAGFSILQTDSLFYFPHLLRGLRWLEPTLAALPFGGQYLILARRA
jgi:SAM-dependent methyltransferase